MDDDYVPRRESGSRIGVLFAGLVVGALIMTAVWVGVAGNPLSDVNEVVYSEITVADVNAEQDTLCWSEDPGRRDAARLCAILALDREIEVPAPGDRVTIGLVTLRPPDTESSLQAVYIGSVAAAGVELPSDEDSATPSP